VNNAIVTSLTFLLYWLLENAEETVQRIVKAGGPNYGPSLDLEPAAIGPATIVLSDEEAAHKYGAVRVPEVDAMREKLEAEFPGIVCPTWFIYRRGLLDLLARGEIGAELERAAKWAVNHSQFAAGLTGTVGTPRVHAAREIKTGRNSEFEFGDPIAGVAICGELITNRLGFETNTAYPSGDAILQRTRDFMRMLYIKARQDGSWHKPGGA
jgi:hypothetical protein